MKRCATLLLLLAAWMPTVSRADDHMVRFHLCDDLRDLRPFMAARASASVPVDGGWSPRAVRIETDFTTADALTVLWDLPPIKADRAAVRVRVGGEAARWRVRIALRSSAGHHYILPTVQAEPDGDGWFVYDRRLDDPGLEVRPDAGHDPNLVVARPTAGGPVPVFTSMSVQVMPDDAAAPANAPVWIDDLALYRDDPPAETGAER